MKVGIIGLPQTGKKTLYQILTGTKYSEHTDIHKLLIGTADIQDSRFDILVNMYSPKKVMRARVDIDLRLVEFMKPNGFIIRMQKNIMKMR